MMSALSVGTHADGLHKVEQSGQTMWIRSICLEVGKQRVYLKLEGTASQSNGLFGKTIVCFGPKVLLLWLSEGASGSLQLSRL